MQLDTFGRCLDAQLRYEDIAHRARQQTAQHVAIATHTRLGHIHPTRHQPPILRLATGR